MYPLLTTVTLFLLISLLTRLQAPYFQHLFSLHHHVLPQKDPSKYYLPAYVFGFLSASFPLAIYMHSPFPPFLLHVPNRILLYKIILIILSEEYKSQKFPLCRFLSSYHNYICFRCAFSPQHPILKEPHPMSLP